MSSYLQSGVKVNCTFMTVSVPKELGVNKKDYTVHTKSGKAILLNKDHKIISATFQCKSPAKFWGGLEMIGAVFAVAALVALTIATGGAALVSQLLYWLQRQEQLL